MGRHIVPPLFLFQDSTQVDARDKTTVIWHSVSTARTPLPKVIASVRSGLEKASDLNSEWSLQALLVKTVQVIEDKASPAKVGFRFLPAHQRSGLRSTVNPC